MSTNNPHSEILYRLLYSEVFNHPLTSKELQHFTDTDDEEVKRSLSELLEYNLVKYYDNHYYLFDSEEKVGKRIAGERRAQQKMGKALKIGRKIARFPYVVGVGISGSLSKGILHDDGDFDYFIVTQPGRLWIARTFLVLYKKLFLFNSRKHFCVNYFIDSDHLEIEEKNNFTATEVATLIPVAGEIMQQFFTQNEWHKMYAHSVLRTTAYPSVKKSVPSRMSMFLLKGALGEKLDAYFMRITLNRWQRKFGYMPDPSFDLTMKTRKYVSKHHPQDFQSRVLNRFDELSKQYTQDHRDTLSKLGIQL